MMSVNNSAANMQVLSSSPDNRETDRTNQSNSKSPRKQLKMVNNKPTVEVNADSPLQRNKHSNTMRQVHVSLKPKPTILEPAGNFIQKK